MNYYVQIEKMSVGYDGKPLIRDIEIGLEKGKILTLIGPNGAGKSTILKSIAKQLHLIGGAVYLGGRSLEQMSGQEISGEMAIVMTEKLRTELMTCEDVVATGRYPYTGRFGILTKKDYEMVEEAIRLVHVEPFRNQDFTKISDGQRQRVMLARAICQEPEIILMDEPTSFLDVKYKLEFLSILQKLQRKKQLTVIMSLHELDLARRVSDKILCIKGDYVERFGNPEEIFFKDYIRSLFGIETGSFDEESGNMELERPKGKPDIFVIGGGGTGKDIYRRLQREHIPFIAGILYENDGEYPVAKALAAETLTAEAFEPIPEDTLEEAKRKLDGCRKLICCRQRFGTMEQANEALFSYAKAQGKEIEMGETIWQK